MYKLYDIVVLIKFSDETIAPSSTGCRTAPHLMCSQHRQKRIPAVWKPRTFQKASRNSCFHFESKLLLRTAQLWCLPGSAQKWLRVHISEMWFTALHFSAASLRAGPKLTKLFVCTYMPLAGSNLVRMYSALRLANIFSYERCKRSESFRIRLVCLGFSQ